MAEIRRCECTGGHADLRQVVAMMDCRDCGGYLAGFDGRIDHVLTALHLLLAACRAADTPSPPAAVVRSLIEVGHLPPDLRIAWPPVPPGKALLGDCPACSPGPERAACSACCGTGISLARACPHCRSSDWDSVDSGRYYVCNRGCGYTWAATDPEWQAQRYSDEMLREAERAGATPSAAEMMGRWLDRQYPGEIQPPPRPPAARPRPDGRGRQAG